MISGAFGTLAFLSPWVLAGLLFLPALWFLLRVTPPAPRLILFPAARLVAGLTPEDTTTSRTPWWILLLRIMTLALVLIALSGPILNPADSLPGAGPIRLVIDNGWAAAQTWPQQKEAAANAIAAAGRDKRDIYIMTTAPEPGSDRPAYYGPLTRAQAEALVRGLRLHPWPADYDAAMRVIAEAGAQVDRPMQSLWLSHGLQEGDGDLHALLQSQGGLRMQTPEPASLPLILRPSDKVAAKLAVKIGAPQTLPPGTPVTVEVGSKDGRILDAQTVTIESRDRPAEIVFDIPDAVRNQVQTVRISGRRGAGALLLLDDRLKRRDVGIIAAAQDGKDAPLIDENFYIARALQPYANITAGAATDILKTTPAVIVMANIGAMPPEELNALESWVRGGGLLLRFAGPNMTQAENFLVPVPLIRGGRALDGALTWDKPLKIAPFDEASPFYSLEPPEEITVRRQILAEPVAGLAQKTWARLEDGTPLITADRRDKGLVVMIHTTATPLWSDMALSGFFVQMLRQIVNMAGGSQPSAATSGSLQPLLTIDGEGALTQPQSHVRPIAAEAFETIIPGPHNPPGLYGRAGYQASLNLGDRIGALSSVRGLPPGAEMAQYEGTAESSLMPLLLAGAFCLFLIDWLAMALMQVAWRMPQAIRRGGATLAAGLFMAIIGAAPVPAQAQAAQNAAIYAGNIHLAFIKTGNASVDRTAQAGLGALADVLKQRTSVEPAGVVGIDPAQAEMAFFPFIYWPVTQEQEMPDETALRNLQFYIDNGGTILFDTRDHNSSAAGAIGQQGGRNAAKLRQLTGSLNIPPLVPMKDDHVLIKSFYLLDSYPGRFDGGTIWVEEQSLSGRDGVSSVIIGANDWAGAWATGGGSGPRIGGGPQQQEMAFRFGVNVVLYALTGNYKADQVHLPHILERLGQ